MLWRLFYCIMRHHFFETKKARNKSLLSLAPQVGLEPTTTRLTAECSAIELLRNMGKRSFNTPFSHGIRRRPTLPGRVQPSTIGAEGLNFCVRDGNRWNPFAITTGNLFSRFGTFLRPPLPASRLSASSGLGISRTLTTAQTSDFCHLLDLSQSS